MNRTLLSIAYEDSSYHAKLCSYADKIKETC